VTGAALLDHADLDKLDADALAAIENAVVASRAAARPAPENVLDNVYISY
jgi:pyruvate dehydrogenase E1 component alpha subunit